jgi:hypothetical protein
LSSAHPWLKKVIDSSYQGQRSPDTFRKCYSFLEPGWRGRQKVAPLTLVFWRRGLDCDISYGMESTPSSRPVSLGWKLLVLLLLAAGVVLGMISAGQTNTHAEIELLNIANLCSNVALMTVGVYWIVVKKLTGLGILMLIISSMVVGFGLHNLLRML